MSTTRAYTLVTEGFENIELDERCGPCPGSICSLQFKVEEVKKRAGQPILMGRLISSKLAGEEFNFRVYSASVPLIRT